MKTITLTQGISVIVDDAAFARFGHLKWYASADGIARRKEVDGGCRRDVYLHRLIAGAKAGEEVKFANGDRTDYRRANLETITKSVRQREATTPLQRVTHHFLRVFPRQRRFGYATVSRQIAAVMARENLAPEQITARILAWQRTTRDMPPWDLAQAPAAPLVDFVPTPVENLPRMIMPEAMPERRPWVRAMYEPWEDDGTA